VVSFTPQPLYPVCGIFLKYSYKCLLLLTCGKSISKILRDVSWVIQDLTAVLKSYYSNEVSTPALRVISAMAPYLWGKLVRSTALTLQINSTYTKVVPMLNQARRHEGYLCLN
jgi:hypothetical protein